jgi:HAE1 family hydrophobic/amphiphilic exporter-1
MSGVGGQWFKPFALTIACSVLVSLFVSFSLDPMLSAYWADPHVPEQKKRWITRKLDRFNAWFNRLANGYRGVIAWALDHRLAVVILALGTFVASFTLPQKGLIGLAVVMAGLAVIVFAVTRPWAWPIKLAVASASVLAIVLLLRLDIPPVGKVGIGFFPEDDKAEFNIQIETPPGSNLEYTRLKAEEAAALVRTYPEVRYTYTTLGGGVSGAVDLGNIFVKLTPKGERDLSVEEFAALVRDGVKRIAGATLAVFTVDFGGGRKQLALQLKGPDLASISTAAEQVMNQVKQVPNAVDVSLSSKGLKPELNVELQRGLAGSMGVTVGQVAQSLRPAFAGIDAGDWVDPSGDTRDVVVRLTPEARRRAEDLRQIPLVVAGPEGPVTIPLGQVAKIEESVGPAVINHLDRDLVVNVEWNVSGRSTGEVMTDVRQRLARLQLGTGITISEGGDAEQQSEVFGSIFVALGVAVLLMYLILVMQFGSFLDPLAILMSLPLSLIGVMLGLALTGGTINIMSLIGVILLMGIVAKNAILLIDFAKWAREKDGLPLREALIEAGAIRLRPILMTTFALIAGMIPVALGRGEGAQFRAPLGVAVIGGTLTSTLLTLLVIPTVYEILDDWRGSLLGRFRRMVGARKTPPLAEPQPAAE